MGDKEHNKHKTLFPLHLPIPDAYCSYLKQRESLLDGWGLWGGEIRLWDGTNDGEPRQGSPQSLQECCYSQSCHLNHHCYPLPPLPRGGVPIARKGIVILVQIRSYYFFLINLMFSFAGLKLRFGDHF